MTGLPPFSRTASSSEHVCAQAGKQGVARDNLGHGTLVSMTYVCRVYRAYLKQCSSVLDLARQSGDHGTPWDAREQQESGPRELQS